MEQRCAVQLHSSSWVGVAHSFMPDLDERRKKICNMFKPLSCFHSPNSKCHTKLL